MGKLPPLGLRKQQRQEPSFRNGFRAVSSVNVHGYVHSWGDKWHNQRMNAVLTACLMGRSAVRVRCLPWQQHIQPGQFVARARMCL